MRLTEGLVAERREEIGPLRIVVTCPTFRIGGWTTYALNLGRGLRSLGHKTFLLVPDPFGTMYEELRDAFDEVIVVRRRLEGRTAYLRRIVGVLRAVGPDAVVNNAVPFVQAAFPFLPRECARFSVIHSPASEEIALARSSREFVDRVVAVAPNIYERASDRHGRAPEVVELPPGIPIPPAVPERRKGTSLRLAYVGRVTGLAKNLTLLEQVLARALDRQLNVTLAVAGDGDYLRAMKQNARTGGYGDRVRFLGALDRAEVAALLDASDVLVLTSTYEGSPQALLEAMARGVVPVVSRIHGATSAIISNSQNGFLCDIERPDEFVDALAALAEDQALLQRLSDGARETVRRNYDIAHVAGTYARWISESRLGSRPLRVEERPYVQDDLRPYCTGYVRQARRLMGDVARGLLSGERVVGP